jgi:hypothetical protein
MNCYARVKKQIMKNQKIKNPCPICGGKTDSQGWCGSRNHDAGNPFGGINCIIVYPEKAKKKEIELKRETVRVTESA